MLQGKTLHIVFSRRALEDLTRIEEYLEPLDTRAERLYALTVGIKNLALQWALNPYFDRNLELRVHYVGHWYSVFYTTEHRLETIVVVAILAQSEDIDRLEG
jgi:plasmid stabilization system protein ParE